jgi:hypothetical protein
MIAPPSNRSQRAAGRGGARLNASRRGLARPNAACRAGRTRIFLRETAGHRIGRGSPVPGRAGDGAERRRGAACGSIGLWSLAATP